MYPTLWKTNLFGVQLDFHAYTFFLALAFLIGTLLPIRKNYQRPDPFPVTPIGGLWVFFGALIGAKMYWQVQYGDPSDILRVFRIWEGGLVFYGGLFGGLFGALAYLKVSRAPILPVGDLAMPYVPLAHAVARLGCFLNGCCWGSRTELPWAVHYPRAHYGPFQQQVDENLITYEATHSLGVHPSQLYESAGLVLIFLLMRSAYKMPHRKGEVLILYPLCYGVLRFLTEATRGDSARPIYSMTASQMVAIGFVATSFILFGLFKVTVWRESTAGAVAAETGKENREL